MTTWSRSSSLSRGRETAWGHLKLGAHCRRSNEKMWKNTSTEETHSHEVSLITMLTICKHNSAVCNWHHFHVSCAMTRRHAERLADDDEVNIRQAAHEILTSYYPAKDKNVPTVSVICKRLKRLMVYVKRDLQRGHPDVQGSKGGHKRKARLKPVAPRTERRGVTPIVPGEDTLSIASLCGERGSANPEKLGNGTRQRAHQRHRACG